ncbi:hypothetical protein K491DRAFT_677379 [Lophiostoma macrostomum CBS 122681]|uniref:Uncharacterized protein n=1 Tax=Lophiostoma macrostomum CBS 122681 TaxID=1314788 RepID=A0A6A6TBK8_9PLEO|nr:hypothetical protein K491DRAFT_677379 [Lophiostoma macrostomum CBS 122681]
MLKKAKELDNNADITSDALMPMMSWNLTCKQREKGTEHGDTRDRNTSLWKGWRFDQKSHAKIKGSTLIGTGRGFFQDVAKCRHTRKGHRLALHAFIIWSNHLAHRLVPSRLKSTHSNDDLIKSAKSERGLLFALCGSSQSVVHADFGHRFRKSKAGMACYGELLGKTSIELSTLCTHMFSASSLEETKELHDGSLPNGPRVLDQSFQASYSNDVVIVHHGLETWKTMRSEH